MDEPFSPWILHVGTDIIILPWLDILCFLEVVCLVLLFWWLSCVQHFCVPMDCSPSGSSPMEFPRQEYWSGLPFPSPEDLPNSGIKSVFPTLTSGFFITEPPREAQFACLLFPISILTYTETDKIIPVFQRQIWMPFYENTFIVWRREWQPTSPFLPGEFHGQRSLAGYSSWGHKESDMPEHLSFFTVQHSQSFWN